MKLTVVKTFQFDCAHMLSGHEGLCKNLHGHTYKLEVEVTHFGSGDTFPQGPSAGMVVDFKDLKEQVNRAIVSKFDHAFVYWKEAEGPEAELAELVNRLGMKTVSVPYRPTAENMAKSFFGKLKNVFQDSSYSIVRVTVWETPTSYASFGI